jgi:hypothetical protein
MRWPVLQPPALPAGRGRWLWPAVRACGRNGPTRLTEGEAARLARHQRVQTLAHGGFGLVRVHRQERESFQAGHADQASIGQAKRARILYSDSVRGGPDHARRRGISARRRDATEREQEGAKRANCALAQASGRVQSRSPLMPASQTRTIGKRLSDCNLQASRRGFPLPWRKQHGGLAKSANCVKTDGAVA